MIGLLAITTAALLMVLPSSHSSPIAALNAGVLNNDNDNDDNLQRAGAASFRIPTSLGVDDPESLILMMLLNRRVDLATAAGFKKKPPEPMRQEEHEEEEEVNQDDDDDNDENPQGYPARAGRMPEKRTNSMSVVNSMDVMRDRVLLELGRRKAMKDQHTMGDNRHLLQFVGKRSSSSFDDVLPVRKLLFHHRHRYRRHQRQPAPTNALN